MPPPEAGLMSFYVSVAFGAVNRSLPLAARLLAVAVAAAALALIAQVTECKWAVESRAALASNISPSLSCI